MLYNTNIEATVITRKCILQFVFALAYLHQSWNLTTVCTTHTSLQTLLSINIKGRLQRPQQ